MSSFGVRRSSCDETDSTTLSVHDMVWAMPEEQPKGKAGRWKNNTVWRWLLWPALIVLALNIETFAQSIGADRALTWIAVRGGPMIGWATQFLTSQAALYVALVGVGGGMYAWTEYLSKREPAVIPDEEMAKLLLNNTAKLARSLANCLTYDPIYPIAKDHVGLISEAFREVTLPSLPEYDPDDQDSVNRLRYYLVCIAPLIEAGHLNLAEDVGAMILNRLAEEPEPQQLVSIGPETPL